MATLLNINEVAALLLLLGQLRLKTCLCQLNILFSAGQSRRFDLDNQALVDSIVRYLPEFTDDEVRDDPDGLLMVIRAASNHGLDRENDLRLDQS